MSKTIKLWNGCELPSVGMGTYSSKNKHQAGDAVEFAIMNGYRHIDTAQIYHNEEVIGERVSKMISEGKVKREELFMVSKLWVTCHSKEHVRKHLEISLKNLQVDYLDLFYIHWPVAFEYIGDDLDEKMRPKRTNISIRETWEEMEKLVDEGLVKSLGVSNFSIQSLIELQSYCRIKPVVNEVEMHPYLNQMNLRKYCQDNGIVVTAYSPLCHAAIKHDPIVEEIAKSHNKSIAQVLLRWGVQSGAAVIPKSFTEARIAENIDIFDFELTPENMESINKLNNNTRLCHTVYRVRVFD